MAEGFTLKITMFFQTKLALRNFSEEDFAYNRSNTYSFYYSQHKNPRDVNLSDTDPGAASSLSEVFLSLVRLRRAESASVSVGDKFASRGY